MSDLPTRKSIESSLEWDYFTNDTRAILEAYRDGRLVEREPEPVNVGKYSGQCAHGVRICDRCPECYPPISPNKPEPSLEVGGYAIYENTGGAVEVLGFSGDWSVLPGGVLVKGVGQDISATVHRKFLTPAKRVPWPAEKYEAGMVLSCKNANKVLIVISVIPSGAFTVVDLSDERDDGKVHLRSFSHLSQCFELLNHADGTLCNPPQELYTYEPIESQGGDV